MSINTTFFGDITFNDAVKLSNDLDDLARKSAISINDLTNAKLLTTTPVDFQRSLYTMTITPTSPEQKDRLREMFIESVKTHLTPKRILRHGPATIVFWQDGTKTIVKLSEGEEDNAYSAFTAALAIKIFGSNSKLKKMVKKLTEEQK